MKKHSIRKLIHLCKICFSGGVAESKMAECTGLENQQGFTPFGVRIPPPPQNK